MAYYNPAQGHPQGQYPAPIVYYAAPAITYQQAVTKHYGQYYAKETSTGLGATQIVVACVSIAAGIMAIVSGAECYYIGVGIWAGALYLVAGSLAIAAGKDPTNSLITATLVFSVFDFLLGIAELTIAAIGLAEDLYCNYYSSYYNYCTDWLVGAISANSMMVAAGSLEIIFGISMIAVSARAIDKGSKTQMTTIPITYAPQQQPETIFIQAPSTDQSQPPPYIIAQQQYPSTSNPQQQMMYVGVQQQYPSTSNQQQQMMHVGVHQAPLTSIKL